jgi:hypothetical protein
VHSFLWYFNIRWYKNIFGDWIDFGFTSRDRCFTDYSFVNGEAIDCCHAWWYYFKLLCTSTFIPSSFSGWICLFALNALLDLFGRSTILSRLKWANKFRRLLQK